MYLQTTYSGVGQRQVSWPSMAAVVLVHVVAVLAMAAPRPQVRILPEAPILVSLVPSSPTPQPLATTRASPSDPTPRANPKPSRPVTAPAMSLPDPVMATHEQTKSAAPAPSAAPSEKTESPAARVESSATPQKPEMPVAEKTSASDESDEPPRFDADYLDNPNPGYPPLSRKLRESGEVLLRVRVNAEGRPELLTLHRSSGFERLDERAMATVRLWKFLPARIGGKPVEAWVIVPILFSLKG